MKRRTFIKLVGASALGLPFAYSQISRGPNLRRRGAPKVERVACSLPLTAEEKAVVSVLERRSRGVYILGGCAAGKAAGAQFPYLNLLADSKEFAALKQELFAFGVAPVSTPELPGHFIRFVHKGKAYSVLNLDLNTYLKQNVLGRDISLLPLAHNFVVYSVSEGWVMDPYGALQAKTARDRNRIRLVQDPSGVLASLDVCLAVAFDTHYLGLQAPIGHAAFERSVLATKVKAEKEAATVFQQVVGYFPDLLEARGLEFTRKYLLSKLCQSAAALGPGIDLRETDRALQEMARNGKAVSSVHLISAIDRQFDHGQAGTIPGVGVGLPDYMASRKLPMRRKDLLAEVMEGKQPLEAA